MPPTGLRELKKTRTRNQIVEALIELINQDGYDAATVEQICVKTEITAPTFYNYFASKEAVLVHFYTETMQHIHETMKAQSDGEFTLEARLRGFVSRLAADSLANSRLWKALMLYGGNFLASDDERRATGHQIESTYKAMFSEAQENGEIRHDLSPFLLSTVFDGAIYMIGHRWAIGSITDDTLEQTFQDAVTACLSGMRG